MINKIIYIWIFVSLVLLTVSFVNIDDQLFLPSIAVIIFALLIITYYKTRSLREISKIILFVCLFSICSSISLFDNYVSTTFEEQDGISISNTLSYLYIGEDGWSVELFRRIYEQALLVTGILIFVYLLILVANILKADKN